MQLFWAHGYEGTTLADLQKAMGGITAPSFYAAFGSKEELFREAVQLYKKVELAPLLKALMEGPTARESIDGMLHAAAAGISGRNTPRGCLMVLGAVNCAAANKGIEDFLREERATRNHAVAQRLRRGVTDGDLPSSTDATALASFYTSLADGMAVRAKDGASHKSLERIVNSAIASWDVIVESTGKS